MNYYKKSIFSRSPSCLQSASWLVIQWICLDRMGKEQVPNATDSATNQVEVHSLDSCDDIPQADASPAIDMKSWQLPF